jgi:hypothetical protein
LSQTGADDVACSVSGRDEQPFQHNLTQHIQHNLRSIDSIAASNLVGHHRIRHTPDTTNRPQAAASSELAFLQTLKTDSQRVSFSCMGSESDLGVSPVLLAVPAPDERAAAAQQGGGGGDEGEDQEEEEDEEEEEEEEEEEGEGAMRRALAALQIPPSMVRRFAAYKQKTFDSADEFCRWVGRGGHGDGMGWASRCWSATVKNELWDCFAFLVVTIVSAQSNGLECRNTQHTCKPTPHTHAHTHNHTYSYMSTEELKLDEEPEDPHRAAMLRSIKLLAGHAQPPFVQLFAGNEGMYNPIPVFWLGQAPAVGDILVGLVSGVVWT